MPGRGEWWTSRVLLAVSGVEWPGSGWWPVASGSLWPVCGGSQATAQFPRGPTVPAPP